MNNEKYILKKSKVNGKVYHQLWKGSSTAKMKYFRNIGTLDNLVKLLNNSDRLITLTKKYPNFLTKLTEWENKEKD